MWWVKCACFNCGLTKQFAAQIPREQKGKNKYQRAIVSEICSALTHTESKRNQEMISTPAEWLPNIFCDSFLSRTVFLRGFLRPTWWSSNSRLRSASLPVLRGLTMRRNDEETTPRNARHMTKKGSTPRGYGHTIHPKKALQWQQCAEAKRVSSLYICRIENGGTMWKHVETCGNMDKTLLSSGCIWQSDVPPWRFMALSLTRSFSHVLLSVFQPRCFCASALRWDFSFTPCGMTRMSRSKDPWPQAGEDNELLLWKLRAHERSWEKRKRNMTEIGFRASPRACVCSNQHSYQHRESMDFYDFSTTLLWTLWTDFYRCVVRRTFLQRSESLDSKHTRLRHKRHDIPYHTLSLYLKGPVMHQEGVQTRDISWHRHGMTWTS